MSYAIKFANTGCQLDQKENSAKCLIALKTPNIDR